MQNNAIMQRVLQLSDLWSQEVKTHPEARVFAIMGANLVEYKTIKGFVMFQTSTEKTLPDVFLLYPQPFDGDGGAYAWRLLQQLHGYFQQFNQDSKLVADYGRQVIWEHPYPEKSAVTPKELVAALSSLAAALHIDGRREILAIALFPEQVSDFDQLTAWMTQLAAVEIPVSLRFMLYDNTEAALYKDLVKHNAKARYIKPDLDIPGAMDQILEEAKAKKTSPEEIDMIRFQQNLIKLNEASTYSSEKDVLFYKKECCTITQRHRWLQQEAIVYFFLHNFYSGIDKAKALESIDTAIRLSDEAVLKGLTKNNQEQFQYRIAKGNLYYFDKNLSEAANIYKAALALDRKDSNPMMLAGLYQMLASCQRRTEGNKAAAATLLSGWQLLIQMPAEELKENPMPLFYARDMLELNDPRLTQHLPLMNELWGTDWQYRIRNHKAYQTYAGADNN
ncbi:hypothetical protein [Chitinophaga varians]|uniref:hypothetical protein n=1 Tax=Chitinophaga varians TaxID=2202339 RepID=UPI00165F1419|nr:hypothetical protein [Chitinophaga varians]MBC9913108.1 hypothetical protein [Chitinophaga varians]